MVQFSSQRRFLNPVLYMHTITIYCLSFFCVCMCVFVYFTLSIIVHLDLSLLYPLTIIIEYHTFLPGFEVCSFSLKIVLHHPVSENFTYLVCLYYVL